MTFGTYVWDRALALVVTWILCIYSTMSPTSAAGPAQRLLHFPTDRAVGQVESRPVALGGFGVNDNWYEGWESLGPAQGDVEIPTGHYARLNVSKSASKDLSFLDSLDPDAIDVLILRGTDVTDDGLQHVASFVNLQFLDLQQTRITDACAPHFVSLKKLVRIDLGAFDVNKQGFGVGDKVLTVLGTLPALETVYLRLTKVTDAGMAELAKCLSLQNVSIEGTPVTDEGLKHLAKLPKLIGLELGVYDEGAKVTDEGMKSVSQISGLEWLNLSGTPITGEGLKNLADLKKLRILGLEETKITNADLAFLEPLQGLERLRLFDSVNDEGAKHLGKLKNLQSISANLEVSDIGVSHLTKLHHLQELMLSERNVTDASIAEIARMPLLKTLWFQRCKVTDAGLAKLRDHPKLEYVLFSNIPITTASLETFATWPKLKILNVDIDRKSDPRPDWGSLAKLTQVEWVDLGGDAFESKDMVHLAALKQLKHLEIDPSKPFDDSGMMQISALENLEALDLRSSEITDKGMEALRNKPKMETMTISGLITDKGLAALYDSKSLGYLQISSPYITEQGLAALADHVPTLREINRYNYNLKGWYVSATTKDRFLRRGTQDTRPAKDALEDKPAPEIIVDAWLNHEDTDWQLGELKGKVVLVDFWGAWCQPCVNKIPELKKLYDDNHDAGFEIVGIHTTQDGDSAEMYTSPMLMPWPNGIDLRDQTKKAWAVDDYPAYYLIDRAGNLRFADIYPEQLAEAVQHLLDEKSEE